MPDIIYDTREAVPEGLRDHAKQNDGGKFVVSVEPAAKLKEFRDNNIKFQRERDEANSWREGVKSIVGDDVEAFKTRFASLVDMETKVKDGSLKGSDAIEREVANRLKSKEEALGGQIRDLTQKLQAATTESAEAKNKLNRMTLHQAITQAVMGPDSPINPVAMADVLTRAEQIYSVGENGALIPKKDGLIVYSMKDGSTPMSPAEWLVNLVKEAPHLGKASNGGGANGGNNNAQFAGLTQEAFLKLSPQERIARFREAQAKT